MVAGMLDFKCDIQIPQMVKIITPPKYSQSKIKPCELSKRKFYNKNPSDRVYAIPSRLKSFPWCFSHGEINKQIYHPSRERYTCISSYIRVKSRLGKPN